ncbi:hypothetical protein [Paraburkholderia aromaticivorans]|uniref:hypothetical protein n=1 Tax=Paraburkholderia aromaticivorans TaxID=2026199 RepID=UPI001FC9B5F1|nr:hypothetical protein [Paraburkholderia aromaticivorans]
MRLQRESGIALLFITHDVENVRAVADAVLAIEEGHATYVDAPQQEAFFEQPALRLATKSWPGGFQA